MALPLLEQFTTALQDRYRVERELGRGGMAVVLLAEDLKHHRRVALKVLQPELSAALGGDRFLREIEIVAGLQHPHILPLYDSGQVATEGAGTLLYYVMPYAEGNPSASASRAKASFPSTPRSGSPAKSAARCSTPTSTAWSTATSSPKT